MTKSKIHFDSNSILLIHFEKAQFVNRFKNFFEEKGFDIIHASSIEEAYPILETQTVDIVVLDMDEDYDAAFKLCYHLKKKKDLQDIFVIALSQAQERFDIFLDARTAEEKRWLNVDLFVHKPIGAKNLYLILKKEIAKLKGIDARDLDSD